MSDFLSAAAFIDPPPGRYRKFSWAIQVKGRPRHTPGRGGNPAGRLEWSADTTTGGRARYLCFQCLLGASSRLGSLSYGAGFALG